MTIKTLPCINCLILGRCKAELFDMNGSVYGEYHKSVTINKLMNECSLLHEYVSIHAKVQNLDHDIIDTDKIPLIVDYLVSGVIHDEPDPM